MRRSPTAPGPRRSRPSPSSPARYASTRCGSTARHLLARGPAARGRAGRPRRGTTAPPPPTCCPHPGTSARGSTSTAAARMPCADGTVVFSHVGDDRVHRLDAGATEPGADHPGGSRGASAGSSCTASTSTPCARTTPATPEPANELVRLDLRGDEPRRRDGAGDRQRLRVASGGLARRHDRSRGSRGTTRTCPGTPPACTGRRSPPTAVTAVEVVCRAAEGVSVVHPVFGPDGALWFVSDDVGLVDAAPRHRRRTGGPARPPRPTTPTPQWGLGTVDLAVLDADRALVRWWDDGDPRLGVLDARTGEIEPRRPSRGAPSTACRPSRTRSRCAAASSTGCPRSSAGRCRAALRVLGRSGEVAARPPATSPPSSPGRGPTPTG